MTAKKILTSLVVVVAFSFVCTVPALAQKITVEEALLAVLIDDFKIDDYSADATVDQGTGGEQRGTLVYQKTNKLRMTFTENGTGSPIDKVVVTNEQSVTVFDNDADTVQFQALGKDPMNMDLRSLYYLSSQSPVLYWTFADGSTIKDVDPSDQYDLKLQGANFDITIKVDVARRVLLEKVADLGGGNTFRQTFSNFSPVSSVYMPGRQDIDYAGATRVDIFSNYGLNQNPAASLFEVP
jgi:outer membrane lipoprotein-sorting protein